MFEQGSVAKEMGVIMKPGMNEEEKLAYAKQIGVSFYKIYDGDTNLKEAELNARILEHERATRDSRLWIVALVSAIASALSALAAWFAVLMR